MRDPCGTPSAGLQEVQKGEMDSGVFVTFPDPAGSRSGRFHAGGLFRRFEMNCFWDFASSGVCKRTLRVAGTSTVDGKR